jgi:hypothetical protein
MHEVEPNVSTPSNFFTKTNFFCNLAAVRAIAIVKRLNNPSGTLATNIPTQNIIPSSQETCTTNIANRRNKTPKNTAITVI